MASPPAALARLPLFERLADADPGRADDARPIHVLDRAGLQASVWRELMRIMNRRCVPRPQAELSVLEYGLPDWTGLYASNPDDRLRIGRSVLRAVRAFEPRLGEPKVEVTPSARGAQVLTIHLGGRLVRWSVATVAMTGTALSIGRSGSPRSTSARPRCVRRPSTRTRCRVV